jgi:hypothetical protein
MPRASGTELCACFESAFFSAKLIDFASLSGDAAQ